MQDPPHTTARQKRAEQMREKREQQKRKRETTRAKLGESDFVSQFRNYRHTLSELVQAL